MASAMIKCPRLGTVKLDASIEEHGGIKCIVISDQANGGTVYRSIYSIKAGLALANLINNLELPKER